MRSDEPGPLTAKERELLDGVLAHGFQGVEALRVQAQSVEAKKGCNCGCGTIDLIPRGERPPTSNAASPVPIEGRVVDDDGREVGGLLLFLKYGLLDSLEIYSYAKPLQLPNIDRVRWALAPR